MRYLRLIFIFIFVISGVTLGFHLRSCAAAQGTDTEETIYTCPMHPNYTSEKPGNCPICGMALVKKVIASAQQNVKPKQEGAMPPASPMPASSSSKKPRQICLLHKCAMKNCGMMIEGNLKPGEKVTCPICGQYIVTKDGTLAQLMPEQNTLPPAGSTVMITPEQQQLIGVATQPVTPRMLVKTIHASGKIAYDPDLVVAQEEFIQALVHRDQVKDSPLKEVLEQANSLASSSRKKLQLLGMSERQIAQLEKNRKADSGLYLPTQGQNVWAYLSIYEYEISAVTVGQEVTIEAVAFPGEKFAGKVSSLSPVLDIENRTEQVRVEVENPDNKLKPEMFVNAQIISTLGEKLALPKTAVMDTGARKIVYLSRPNGILEMREVTLGEESDHDFEVVAGLNEGDVVVTSGNFLVDSESKIKATLDQPEHPHNP